ncbi:hypothetical protein GF356_00775 [candidate division GN15 bacterium]|nr:hypothetical protein [candidate division GN15 bacterium]
MMHTVKTPILVVLSVVVLLVATAFAAQTFEVRPNSNPEDVYNPPVESSDDAKSGDYQGTVKVYVSEYQSTKGWWDAFGQRYEMAFLDYALEEALTIPQFDTVTFTVNWNSDTAGWGSIQQDNIVATAAVFNADAHTGYSYPPAGYPFTSYWVDAAAEAAPGQIGRDTAFGGLNHAVFVEQATATWCGFCPYAGGRLRIIKESGQYPMYYVALVDDKNPLAAARINEFNLYGFPTVYFDGGHGVEVGSDNYNTDTYEAAIEAAGQRTGVPDLDLTLQTSWVGTNEIQVTVTIVNNNNTAPDTPGTLSLDKDTLAAGETLTCQTYAEDPEGNDVYFMFDYGNGENSGWIGPYASNALCEHTYEFPAPGEYEVKVQARDEFEEMSEWSQSYTTTVYECGDANGQGDGVNVSDLTFLVAYLFSGGQAPPILQSGDVNNDAAVNIADLTALVAYLFGGGANPSCY